jgi:hypothetical protein
MDFKWDDLDFETLEAFVFRLVLQIVRHTLKIILEDMDKYLAAERDKARYESKEIDERTLDTLVGPLRFKRRCYRDKDTGERVHLLDEKLKIKGYKRVSEGLVRAAVSLAAAGPSYRNSRDRMNDLLGEKMLSHEGIRQLVLKTSDVIQDSKLPNTPLKKIDVLFIEADGFYTGRQGKKKRARQKTRKKKKEESKLSVVHEGWKKRYPGSKEYQTVKSFRYMRSKCAPKVFWEGLRDNLKRMYDLDHAMVVINGDGADWIRSGTEYFPKAIYQYDRFHVSQGVSRALSWNKRLKKEALQALRRNNFRCLKDALMKALSKGDEKQKDKVNNVLITIRSNWRYIVDYRLRLKAKKYPYEGFRGLGSGESNIGKMKSRTRGRSWSSEGLEALGNVLFRLLDGSLGNYTSGIRSRLEKQVPKMAKAGAEVARKAFHDLKSGAKRGHFPCLDRGTEGYAVLFRQILEGGFSF